LYNNVLKKKLINNDKQEAKLLLG